MKNIFLILFILTLAVPAGADSIACPEMGLPLKPSHNQMPPGTVQKDYIKDLHSGSAACEYGSQNRVLLSWFSSLSENMWQDKCRQRQSLEGDGPVHVKFVKNKRWVILSSKTHLSLVYIWLSKKEYRKRRLEWAEAGKALLRTEMSRGMSCAEYEPYDPQRRPRSPEAVPQPPKPMSQGRTPVQERQTPPPPMRDPVPQPVVQPDNVDEKIDDILERLKAE